MAHAGNSKWTRRSVLASTLALAACAARVPRLEDFYGDARVPKNQPPLIFIPGAFGSRLRDRQTRQEIWPASDPELLLGNFRSLELPFDRATLESVDDGIEAYDVFREGLGRDFYGESIRQLQRVGGYRLVRPGEPPPDDACPLYPFLYDFRRDNLRAVRALDALIAQIRSDLQDPQLRVDVLAHSNGGLIARYYARYGAVDMPDTGAFAPTCAGAANLRRLLLVGTPNLGTMQPVLSLVRGEEVGLRHIPPEVVATCPGLAQLMPHPGVPWIVDGRGRVLDLDLYDTATWRDLRWGLWEPHIAERTRDLHGGGAEGRRYVEALRLALAQSLRRGRRFAEALDAPCAPDDVLTWLFGSDCELTLARVVAEDMGPVLRARERVDDIIAPAPNVDYESVMFEPGDTVVTRSSLLGVTTVAGAAAAGAAAGAPAVTDASAAATTGLGNVVQSRFFCERHQGLTGNLACLDNVLLALWSGDD